MPWVVTLIIIPMTVWFVLGYLRNPGEGEKGKVALPVFFIIAGIVVVVLGIGAGIAAYLSGAKTTGIFLSLFSILGIILIIAFCNCRIQYGEDTFCAKNFFGAKNEYRYSDITAVKDNEHECYLYMGKRRIMIDEMSIGGREFLAYAAKRYHEINGTEIPQK